MNKVFEKIIEKLEDLEIHFDNDYFSSNREGMIVKNDAIEIVKQEAEQFGTDINVGSNGWIACSERLPKEYGDYLVWWTDITRKQYYEIAEYEPNNGWIGEIPQAKGEYSVIAWQPLPEVYKN